MHYLTDLLGGVEGTQDVSDVVERRVNDKVVVGQTVRLQRRQVDKHMVRRIDTVRVRMRVLSAALEVLAAHQTGIHIDFGERHRTQFLKVKIKHFAVNGVQVGASPRRRTTQTKSETAAPSSTARVCQRNRETFQKSAKMMRVSFF